ncbi:MAG: OmpA family protein [Ferrimonas sp.]
MHRLFLAGIFLCTLTGCAHSDIVDWQHTTQQQDLSDPDQDGVITAREQCNNSIPSAQVDNNGCGQQQQFRAQRELKVAFPNDSADIDSRYHQEVKQIAMFMHQYPETTITIEGHSSNIGTRIYNQQLSLRRAEAVRSLLINQFQVASSRIIAKGYGFEQPLDPSDSPNAHQRNRRVMATITTQDANTILRWNVWRVGR